jgi:hypothetical protein
MFDDLVTATTTTTSGAGAVDAWTRVESAACARRLAAMVTMLDDAYAADGSASRDQWCLDNWGAVCAHIGAAQRLTSGAASGMLLVGTALRDRLPKVAAVFAEGLLGYALVRTIVARTTLIKDPEALTAVDTAIATALRTWEPMSVTKTEQTIDAYVTQFDPDALHRTHTGARTRSVDVTYQNGTGLADLFGTLFAPDAAALDARLDALADTVCNADPRTKDQRRADAMGTLAHGGDRLACLCDTEDCPAADTPPSSGVVVYVIAHQDTIDGISTPVPEGPHTDNGDEPHSPPPDADEEGCTDANSTVDDDCAGLDGVPPSLFIKPLRDLNLTEALTDTKPGRHSSIRLGVMSDDWGPIPPRTGPAPRRPQRHPGADPPSPPGPTRTSLHPVKEAGRLRS